MIFSLEYLPKIRIWIPSSITLLSAICCLIALIFWPEIVGKCLLCCSLLLDSIDGYVARKLHAETRFGVLLDIRSDSALSVAVAWRCWGSPTSLVVTFILLLMHTLAGYYDKRVSGRWIISCLALLI